MTKSTMFTDSASLSSAKRALKKRLGTYKAFAAAFSYPDERLFEIFSDAVARKEKLIKEYDELFRANGIWLYGLEYMAGNEFERAKGLADINGFYRAFGVEPKSDRPDALPCELEFMHLVIFKELSALKLSDVRKRTERATICLDAEKKFFFEHLYPAAKSISTAVTSRSGNNFYSEAAKDLLEFLESERKFLKGN